MAVKRTKLPGGWHVLVDNGDEEVIFRSKSGKELLFVIIEVSATPGAANFTTVRYRGTKWSHDDYTNKWCKFNKGQCTVQNPPTTFLALVRHAQQMILSQV